MPKKAFFINQMYEMNAYIAAPTHNTPHHEHNE